MSSTAFSPDACDAQRRQDGSILVRVHSCDRAGRQLPDAVFTFRSGDPQYAYWEARAMSNGGTTDGCRVQREE
ncbi:MAG: hypothetical protein ABSG68_24755 [Thermoguttaceae bacterium]|jgi:hypothetical protein